MKKISSFILIVLCLFMTACNKEVENNSNQEENKEPIVEQKKVSIIDLDSNTRPYAVVINNYPSAVKVQSGLDKAYVVYEFPIEGGMSRSLAFFKDIDDVKLGTIRSARHNYMDYVYEHDAIFVHFGGSAKAYEELRSSNIDHMDGNTTDSTPFWREQHEGLAYEHRVYTNLSKIIDYNTKTKKFRTTTDNKTPFKYSVDEIELNDKEDSKVANSIDVYYSSSYYINFKYNSETKRYERYFKKTPHTDYFTKKQFDCKNIIITLISWGYDTSHKDAAKNNYLDLNNTGTGEGYYITNGYLVPITWQKDTRSSKTIYRYKDGTELNINDGNTWVMIMSKTGKLNIE